MIDQAIAVINGKGGVGKSSFVANFGGLVAGSGWRVLIVDFDYQGNVGLDLGYTDRSDQGQALFAAVQGGGRLEPLRNVRQNLDVVPGGNATEDLSDLLAARSRRDGDALGAVEQAVGAVADDYDLILFDCPPGDRVLQDAVLRTTHFMIIPTSADEGSLDGLTKVAGRASGARQYNPALTLLGVVLFNFVPRGTAIIEETVAAVRKGLTIGGVQIAPVWRPPIRNALRAAKDCREGGFLVHEYEKRAATAKRWYEGGTERFSGAASTLADDYFQLAGQARTAFVEALNGQPVADGR